MPHTDLWGATFRVLNFPKWVTAAPLIVRRALVVPSHSGSSPGTIPTVSCSLPCDKHHPRSWASGDPGSGYHLLCPVGAEPSPALLVPSAKRRSRKTSKDTGEGKEGATAGSEEPGGKARGRGRKPSTKAKGGRLPWSWLGLGQSKVG